MEYGGTFSQSIPVRGGKGREFALESRRSVHVSIRYFPRIGRNGPFHLEYPPGKKRERRDQRNPVTSADSINHPMHSEPDPEGALRNIREFCTFTIAPVTLAESVGVSLTETEEAVKSDL